MSRSYKHFPYCNFRHSKVKKELLRHYQHRLRSLLKDLDYNIQYSEYKKIPKDTWDLFCGSYRTFKEYLRFERRTSPPYYNHKKHQWGEYDEKDAINWWKKWYYRK